MDTIRTVKKCILKGDKVLRMSLSIEGVWFIFLEYQNEQDMLERRKMLWNGLELCEANTNFQNYKYDPAINKED